MGGSGYVNNGMVAPGSSGGGGFLSGIPLWAYLLVILIGIGLSIFLFVKAAAAKRRASAPPVPGAPPPLAGAAPAAGGGGFMIGGIICGLLLVVAPLVAMLIAQPWSNGGNWLVGRWAERPGCMGETIEFTSDGFALARGDRKPYRLEGNQITVNGRTETIQHDGDRFTVQGETFIRCSGAAGETANAGSSPFGPQPAPPAPTPTPYVPPSTPTSTSAVPDYASWVLGRWSSSDCARAMEFRADGTGTASNGEAVTFQITPAGEGAKVGITIAGTSQRVAGEMEATGPSDAVLRAYQPSAQTINLHRC